MGSEATSNTTIRLERAWKNSVIFNRKLDEIDPDEGYVLDCPPEGPDSRESVDSSGERQ